MKKNNESAYETVMKLIVEYIAANHLQENMSLPPERAMCEKWGFSRTTIRKATKTLEEKGVLYISPQSGIYVAPKKNELRVASSPVTLKNITNINEEFVTKVLRQEVYESDKRISRMLRVNLGTRILLLERVRYLDNKAITIETSFTNIENFQGIEDFDFSKCSLYDTIQNVYKTKIFKDYLKLRVAYINEQEADILECDVNSPFLLSSGLIIDEEGNRVEYYTNRTLSELFSYRVV